MFFCELSFYIILQIYLVQIGLFLRIWEVSDRMFFSMCSFFQRLNGSSFFFFPRPMGHQNLSTVVSASFKDLLTFISLFFFFF